MLCLPNGIESAAFRADVTLAFCQQKVNASRLQLARLFALLAAKFLDRGEAPAIDAIFIFLSEVLEQSENGPSSDAIALKQLLFVESRAIGEALRSDSGSPGSLAKC